MIRAIWERYNGWLLGGLLLAVSLLAGGRALVNQNRGADRLVVYAFSTQEEVLTQAIFPAFEQEWLNSSGQEVTIEGVFGPSGTLAGQINLGAPADVTLFSNAQHVTWLQIGHRVRADAQAAVVGQTPMVIVTRPGNPAKITGYADLAQPGLSLLHADPQSSGAGEWAVLAAYGSAFLESGGLDNESAARAAARAQLEAIWRNVRLLGPSARATLTLFELGAGDAMITYEQDARLAQDRGVALEIVVPRRTVIAQHVAVVVDDNVSRAERPMVAAFLDYLVSPPGQSVLSRYHLRPADSGSGDLPPVEQPFTVEDLGGWSQAYQELIENLWQSEIEPRLDVAPSVRLLEQRD